MRTNIGRKNYSWLWALVGIIFVVVIIVLVIIFLLRGEVSVSKPETDTYAASAIACDGEGIAYPFFAYDSSTSKDIKVNMVFRDDELETISLTYKIYYDSENVIDQSATDNSIAMKRHFNQDGLGMDALGMKFSRLTDATQMTLYTGAGVLNGIAKKYFLIDDDMANYDKNSLYELYVKKGLKCESK